MITIKQTEKLNNNVYRPQLARDSVVSLDGIWKCNNCDINVPFAPESKLSKYARRGELLNAYSNYEKLSKEERIAISRFNYRLKFAKPEFFTKARTILHFDGVDQVCDVYLNDEYLGCHEGGYLSFSFDITDCLCEGENELRVDVKDELSHMYPYGKQRFDRGGMWYTPVSGIWKSVWLENVPDVYATGCKITPDLNGADIEVTTNTGEIIKDRFAPENPRLWSIADPYLYPISITLGEDTFESYVGLRTIEAKGNSILLNGDKIFLHGVLDQGYYPDGLLTAPDLSEYDKDIERMRSLGFNMLRKHIKIEPDYFYFACDKAGMLVCQDMVQSGGYHYFRDTVLPTIGIKKMKDTTKQFRDGRNHSAWKDDYSESKRCTFFMDHCQETQMQLYNFPCIVMYTIFNEAWGQFASDAAYSLLKKADPSRLYDSTSGWFAQEKTDVDSEHIYFRNKRLHPKTRPMFLSECGGYSLPMSGHLFDEAKSYGYGTCKSKEELTNRIEDMYEKMVYPAIDEGLCGCIYTQLSDVEEEINGLYTYDRKECKVVPEQMVSIAKKLSGCIVKEEQAAL